MDQADAELRQTICKVQILAYNHHRHCHFYHHLHHHHHCQRHCLNHLSDDDIIKVWPYEGRDKVDLLVPPQDGQYLFTYG